MNIGRVQASLNAWMVIALILLPFGQPAHDQIDQAVPTLVWTGVMGNAWSASNNWYLLSNPSTHRQPQNGDALAFTGTGTVTANNDMIGLSLAGIGFDADHTNLTGNSVTITDSILTSTNVTGAQINLPVTVHGAVETGVAAGSSLVLGGVVAGGGSLNKTGEGDIILSGNNTFTGGVTISAGTLLLNHQNGAGSGLIQVKNGATLMSHQATISLANPLQIAGIGFSGAVFFDGTTLNLNGDITLTDDATIFGGSQIYLNGAIGGNYGLTFMGGGTFHLGGTTANTFTGNLNILFGSLQLEKSGGAVAVPGNLNVGNDSLALAASTVTNANAQFNPTSLVMLNHNTSLQLGGTSQTVAGINSRSPCDLSLDSAGGKTGSLTIQTPKNGLSYLWCNVVGKGSITVTGYSLQGFNLNSVPFEGSIEIKDSAAGYLDDFHSSGPYIIRQGAVGGLEGNSEVGSTLGDSSGYFIIETYPGSANPKTGSLVLSGDMEAIFSINTEAGPILDVTDLVSLGGVRLNACGMVDAPVTMPAAGETRTLIQNNGTQPIQGFFANLPEGGKGMLTDCWGSGIQYPMRIHYNAGSGNDLTVTRLIRASLTFNMVPGTPKPGESVTLQARMVLTDSVAIPPDKQKKVEFYDGNTLLGMTNFAGEYASFNWSSVGPGVHAIQARYSGDDVYEDVVSGVKWVGVKAFLPLAKK